jgi:hypothetical protein
MFARTVAQAALIACPPPWAARARAGRTEAAASRAASFTLNWGQEILAGDWYACYESIKKGKPCRLAGLALNPSNQRIQLVLIFAACHDNIRSPNRPKHKRRMLHSSPSGIAASLARHQNSKNAFDRGLTLPVLPSKSLREKEKRVKERTLPRHNGTRGSCS